MERISCATLWGGIRNQSIDVCSRSIEASLFSSAADGGKGGDVYFMSVCSQDALTRVAVADVAGHGEPVSAVSQWLYDSLEARMGAVEGNRVLEDLNGLAVARGIPALATGAVIGFYHHDSRVYFSYAGHMPMLVRRAGGESWDAAELQEEKAGSNLPLGVLADTRYDQDCFAASRGDRLFLYTDGLIEAPSSAGERFGQERLRETLTENAELPVGELKQAVLDAALGFAGGSFRHDDTTLIALEVL